MNIMTDSYMGVHIFILIDVVVSFLLMITSLIYFTREWIRKKYYSLRFPERTVRIVMHYPNGMYQYFYRLLPDVDHFILGNKVYYFTEKTLIKANDFFSRKLEEEEYLNIEGKKYEINKELGIKRRWDKYQEIHYHYNNPNPIDFMDIGADGKIKFTAYLEKEFKENDLLTKLLTLTDNKQILVFLFVMVVINTLGLAFLISKEMGWIQ